MSDTKEQLVAEQEAHEAMWREMEILNTTSDEPMSRARFDELMSLDVDLDSLEDVSEPFDLSKSFSLEQEVADRNVITPDKIPGLVTIEGIIDPAIPVGYFTPPCWASTEMDAWLQKFVNKVAYIHSGRLPEFQGGTIGELVEFAITYKRPAQTENLLGVKFKRLGINGSGKWYELQDSSIDQERAIYWGLIYDAAQSKLWQPNSDDNWMAVNESQAKRVLKFYRKDALEKLDYDDKSAAVNAALSDVITCGNVDYAGPIAGWPKGVYYSASGQRMLVTVSPKMVEPKQGSWNTIKTLISQQLGEEQLTYFLGWMKWAHESLTNHTLDPGQLLVLAGPRDCGKTFLQEFVITPILGGRSANPYQYMVGKTDFNSDLCRAEHLMMSDDNPLTDHTSRRNFGAQIKQILTTPTQRLHSKGKDAVMVKPFWRFSISVNDEPEFLMVLPPLDDSMMDKMMLFHVNRPDCLPQTPAERAPFLAQVSAELPAFVWHLANEFEIPKNLESGRFGIKEYHNPTLAESITELSTERHLLQLIDEHIFGIPGTEEWEGTASDLLARLTRVGQSVQNEINHLRINAKSCGRCLKQLSKSIAPSVKGRIRSRTKRGQVLYTITPPSEED
jgi:hypothetical protein